MEALGGRGGIAPTHSRPRHWMGVSGQRHAPAALLPPGKEPPVPIVQEAGGELQHACHTTAVLPLDVADGAVFMLKSRSQILVGYAPHPLCYSRCLYLRQHTIHNTELVTILLRAAGDTSRHVFCCTGRGTCRRRQIPTHKHTFQKSL
jgi:hypothetical protein